MKTPLRMLLSASGLAIAATFVGSLSLPTSTAGFSLIGGNLGIGTSGNGYQRDIRVWNNAADAAANNNNTAEADHPGALGAVLATWKGAQSWGSDNPDANRNFDFDFQGEASNNSSTNGNTVGWSNSGCFGGVVAYTETPISNGWRIVMCESWTWSDGPGSIGGGQIDIEGVGAHELGHALGLGHTGSGCSGSCNSASTMCPFICGGGTNARDVEADDSAGLQAIYGSKPGNKPTITSLSGSTAVGGSLTIHGNNFAGSVSVKFTAGTTQNTGSIPGVVSGVPSGGGGTSVTVTVPAAAQDGNVLVWQPGSLLSNAFPIDIGVGGGPGGTFTQIHPGLAGVSGIPSLSGTGDLTPGGTGATITTSGAASSASGIAFLSGNQGAVAFKGGTLYAVPVLSSFPVSVNGSGSKVLNGTVPAGTPSGTVIVLQEWYVDGAAVEGLSGTNGLRMDVP